MRNKAVISAILVLLANICVLAGDSAPAWLRQAASTTIGTYDKEVTSVVLIDDEQVVYGNDGMLVTTQNYAVRLLTREGRRNAVATALYLVSSGRVRDIEGWLIRPDGTVKNYDKKFIVDIISDPDDVYNEYRVKIIDATDDADAGCIFGYTVVSEDRPLYFQEKWFAQSNLPTLNSRYSLTLPSGWSAKGVIFNHAPIEPSVNGSTYTWEFRNLPYIKREPMSPAVTNVVPWVAINYYPSDPTKSPAKAFSNWTDVALWTTSLYESQVIVDDAVAAKAQELTSGAKTEIEKIRAIAAFVQNLQYISIDIGVGNGNGYRPRPSNLVLNRGYGDCKDKANLMRALLRSIKIDAYPIAIYAGDPTFVRENWASPAQFNHCIIAVKVGDSTEAATVIDHPKLGRLLIFDATDPFTLVGDLPDHLQGSFGMIIAGENGGLTRMPLTPSEANLLDRRIEVNLTPDGAIAGTIKERSTGQSSSYERGRLRSLSASDYTKMLERWLTSGATGAKLLKFTPTDLKDEAAFNLDVDFSAPRYAQNLQRLLVFKPTIVDRRNAMSLTEATRKLPVILDPIAVRETIVFNLPAGFVVDETPDNVEMEFPFGKYSTSYEVQGSKLTFRRVLTMNRATVPVDKYSTVRDFFSKIRQAEQAPVVLIQK